MSYAVYYPDEGRCSRPMSFVQARALSRQFEGSWVVNLKKWEVIR